jgi:hypothetical protein
MVCNVGLSSVDRLVSIVGDSLMPLVGHFDLWRHLLTDDFLYSVLFPH